MWKPGQLITINGDVYRITKTAYLKRYMCCAFCQKRNYMTQCTKPFYNNVKVKNLFTLLDCSKKMPDGCIPVKVNAQGLSSLCNSK
jgi:hypothetical protein